MVTLPTRESLGGRPVPQSGRRVAQISRGDIAATGMALEGAAAAVEDTGKLIADREFTALAKERDAYVSDEIRKILYDPEQGFTVKRGRSAVEQRSAAMQTLQRLKETAAKDLPPGAARKFDASLQNRISAALTTIDRHTGSERDDWLNGASNARINSALQDSIADPTSLDKTLGTIEEEYQGRAAREGWSREEYDFEVGKAKSVAVKNRIMQIGNESPYAAMEALEANKGRLVPAEYEALKQTFEPLAKEERGRLIGQAAALSGVSPQYLSNVKSAESGGRVDAKNPRSSATGLYQFTAGTWAEMIKKHPNAGLTAGGRLDPKQQETAMVLFTAENAEILSRAGLSLTGGNLYAAHFLGAGGASKVLRSDPTASMSSVVSSQVITANPFLSKMTVSDFKAWAHRKGGNEIAFSKGQKSMSDLVTISDPEERKAAIEEFELITSVQVAERDSILREASNAAFEYLEGGGSMSTLPVDVRQGLGMKAMSSLREYEKKLASGQTIQTDPSAYLELRQVQSEDPSAFKRIDMMEYVDRLSRSDWKRFVDDQGDDDPKRESGLAPSTLMTTANRAIKAAGIDGNEDRTASFQSSIVRWQDRFIEKNDRVPSYSEVQDQVSTMLAEVMIDPEGRGNRQGENIMMGGTQYAYEIDYDGESYTAEDDMTMDELLGSTVKINGTRVTAEALEAAAGVLSAEGQDPTPEAVVRFLIEGGYYD